MIKKSNKTISYIDLFSGIGGFRMAIENASRDFGIKPICTAYSEIDSHAIRTYKEYYQHDKKTLELGDITKLNSPKIIKETLPNFNILFAGFPCQPFSLMGSRGGFADTRGTLFYYIEKIIAEKNPELFILENVRGLKTHDNGKTFRYIIDILEKKLRYHVRTEILNSADYGVPQVRRRLYFIGCRNEKLFSEIDKLDFAYNGETKFKTTRDLLEPNADKKHYLSLKLTKTILSNGTGGFRSKSEINQSIARPLTATMHKMHRACQDNYYSDDYIATGTTCATSVAKAAAKQKIRKITPLEAFRLQGFPDEIIHKAKKAGLSDTQLYRQAGNAITVNVAETVLKEIFMKTNFIGSISSH